VEALPSDRRKGMQRDEMLPRGMARLAFLRQCARKDIKVMEAEAGNYFNLASIRAIRLKIWG
jgi:hypothetical protein